LRRKLKSRKHEKEEKTRKRHPDIFFDFVLSEISCFRGEFFFFLQLQTNNAQLPIAL